MDLVGISYLFNFFGFLHVGKHSAVIARAGNLVCRSDTMSSPRHSQKIEISIYVNDAGSPSKTGEYIKGYLCHPFIPQPLISCWSNGIYRWELGWSPDSLPSPNWKIIIVSIAIVNKITENCLRTPWQTKWFPLHLYPEKKFQDPRFKTGPITSHSPSWFLDIS